MCTNVYYYRYGVNGKARVENMKTATKQGYWWFLWYKISVILKKVVSRKTEKVHMLEDNCQIRKIMD